MFWTSGLYHYQRPMSNMLSLPHKLILFFDLLLSSYLGETPYPNLPDESLPGVLKAGYRMDKPQMCSDEM